MTSNIQVGDLFVCLGIRMLVLESFPEYCELFVAYPSGKSKMMVVDKKAIYYYMEEQTWRYYPG